MKTEAEAKKCWCPFVRANAYGAVTNRTERSVKNCIASECMAWRWATLMTPYKATPEMMADRTGFCGLAGQQP